MAHLSKSSYGKGAVRVKKVIKHQDYHEVKEFSVQIICEGDFEKAHLDGDNTLVLPTDTQKNTVYILAKDEAIESIESFGLALTSHFLKGNDQFTAVEVHIVQTIWEQIPANFVLHPYAYQKKGGAEWITTVRRTKDNVSVQSGIQNMEILKTTYSGFSDFKTDAFTTLKDTDDRMLATNLTANWDYDGTNIDFEKVRKGVINQLLVTFSDHKSLSVQHTLYAMGEAALEASLNIREIHIEMPNKHNLLFDLSKFDRSNDNEIFIVTEEPYGLIKGSVCR